MPEARIHLGAPQCRHCLKPMSGIRMEVVPERLIPSMSGGNIVGMDAFFCCNDYVFLPVMRRGIELPAEGTSRFDREEPV